MHGAAQEGRRPRRRGQGSRPRSGVAAVELVLLASAALVAEGDEEAGLGFGEALAVDGAERRPFDHARIQLYLGERLRRSKALAQAREYLSAAAETLGRLGAHPWTDRANKELRACGIRCPPVPCLMAPL